MNIRKFVNKLTHNEIEIMINDNISHYLKNQQIIDENYIKYWDDCEMEYSKNINEKPNLAKTYSDVRYTCHLIKIYLYNNEEVSEYANIYSGSDDLPETEYLYAIINRYPACIYKRSLISSILKKFPDTLKGILISQLDFNEFLDKLR